MAVKEKEDIIKHSEIIEGLSLSDEVKWFEKLKRGTQVFVFEGGERTLIYDRYSYYNDKNSQAKMWKIKLFSRGGKEMEHVGGLYATRKEALAAINDLSKAYGDKVFYLIPFKFSYNEPEKDNKNYKKSGRSAIENIFQILSYLKENTDKCHPTSQGEMRKGELGEYMGTHSTFNQKMVNLALAMDYDPEQMEFKSEEDCRLIYDSLKPLLSNNEDYSDDEDEDEMNDKISLEDRIRSVRNIYYNHPFSPEEVVDLINAVQMSKALNPEQVERLVRKIKMELASKYNRDHTCRIHNNENTDSELLKKNLAVIQSAIKENCQLSYNFCYYTTDKSEYGDEEVPKPVLEFTAAEEIKTHVSPHYIIQDNGRFFLIGCFENDKSKGKRLSIYRIDLMKNVEIRKENGKKILATKADVAKTSVPYKEQLENFRHTHLSMGYDTPKTVKMRVTNFYRTGKPNLTFLHDSFGDDYTITGYDKGVIVSVRTSVYGIVNWALEHSDKVEVLDPSDVVETIKARVRKLNDKYICRWDK